MNKQISEIRGWAVYGLLLIMGLVSCEASLPEEKGDGSVSVFLNIPEELEVSTKSGELDGITIGKVWVLQYTMKTSEDTEPRLLKAGEYTNITTGSSKGTLKVETSGFTDANSNFYIIANAPDNFFAKADTLQGGESNITETNLKKKTMALVTNASQPNFLTSNSISLTQDSIQKYGGKAVVVAPLERAYAQVSLQWAKSSACIDKVTITKVDACNIPKNMAVYPRGGADLNTNYPLSTDMQTTVNVIGSELSQNTKANFWMPENLRGIGTGSSFSEKSMPSKGPAGNLSGCSYILLHGTYAYKLGSSSFSNPIKVQYKIYLGGNLTNDYNIQRGYKYNLTVNIGGANSSDVRVTITDGRVVVFDDVKEMETIIVDF